MENPRLMDSLIFKGRDQADTARRHFQGLIKGPRPELKWIFTLLLLAAVLTIAFHLSEERDFVKILEEASPSWIILGLLFQAGTYYAQSSIWKAGLKKTGHTFGTNQLVGLSLAQLFINQVVPSASVSGALFVSKALGQRKVPAQDVSQVLGLTLLSYFEAYALATSLAIAQLGFHGELETTTVVTLVTLLLVYGLSLVILSLKLTPSGMNEFFRRLKLNKFHATKSILKIIMKMDFGRLGYPLIAKSTLLQLSIFILDFLTLWSMIKALGLSVPVGPIFTSYMTAYLARTIGLLPGGIGVFEAASIASLHQAGLSVAGSLAATLLYRGLSYWLPMLPGLFLVRREFHHERRIKRFRIDHFWSSTPEDLFKNLEGQREGLTAQEARERLLNQGPNQIQGHRFPLVWEIIWNQIKSPLVLLLLLAVLISFMVGDWVDALIILVILLTGTCIGTWKEREAQLILGKLRERLAPKARVIRGGKTKVLPSEELVPGDIISLSAGDLVPADALILEAQDCYVNEASLTGESFPVLKCPSPTGEPSSAALSKRKNALFMGSNVQTGIAKALVVNTGPATLFGSLAESLTKGGPQTDFDRNINSFGYMILKIMLLIVILVFTLKALTSGLSISTLMFSVALAVGLSPELLPLIINYDLAKGAGKLSLKGLLVRHPKALENLAAVDVLCTDKSGTITEGIVDFGGAYDDSGEESQEVLDFAYLNASLQTGMANPMDEILVRQRTRLKNTVVKLGEIPYDFNRKRLSVIVNLNGKCTLITKGSFEKVLEICTYDSKGQVLDTEGREKLHKKFEAWSQEGARILGVAKRDLPHCHDPNRLLEKEMSFIGFLLFLDKPKEHIIEVLNELKNLGIEIKIISGDNTLVTKVIARKVGLDPERCLESKQLNKTSDEALPFLVEKTQLFTQVDPHQKERIVIALKKRGHTVAYMGDGINDVSAMQASDASISVDTAVDVAKTTADIVLLKKSLESVKVGIREGRVTFHNSMKYINITMSANFGNMISMAVASILLPFLPLLAGQILLNNLLSDIPFFGLANDNVDPELLAKPTKWNLRSILRYMIVFGLISTLFDFLVFYVLLKTFHASVSVFRTVWFIESLLTELFIVLVLRTSGPLFKSHPSRLLTALTFLIAILSLIIPFIPGARVMGFTAIKGPLILFIIAVTAIYLVTTEILKRLMSKR